MTTQNSILKKAATAFTGAARPKATQDPTIRPGTLGLWDFTDKRCNPNADGALAIGATFNNMVDGGAAVTVLATGLTSVAGKAGITTPGAGTYIQLGGAGLFDLHASQDELLFNLTFKLPASGLTTGFAPQFGMGSAGAIGNVGTTPFRLDMGSDGKTARAQFGNGSTLSNSQIALAQNVVNQLIVHFKPSTGLIELYVNGALALSQANTPFTLQNGSAMLAYIAGGSAGTTLYRAGFEDVAATAAAEAAMGLTPLSVAQLAANDYLFITGASAIAPRSALV